MGAVKSLANTFSEREYLLYYIERSDFTNISKLLQKNPELIEKSLTQNTKMTPLYRSSFNGNLKMVQFLVQQHKAEVNRITEIGETALIAAIKRKHIQIVRYLLGKGADVNIRSPIGLLTLQYAILPGFYEIALLIYQRTKSKELKNIGQYSELNKMYKYRYVDYAIFIENLQNKIQPQNVPDYLTKPKHVLKDPVVDPRQSWKDWTKRQLEFKDPPLVEREDLPRDLQPQNMRFGKFKFFFSNLAMSPMVQKPTFEPAPSRSTYGLTSNELQVGAATSKDVEMQTHTIS